MRVKKPKRAVLVASLVFVLAAVASVGAPHVLPSPDPGPGEQGKLLPGSRYFVRQSGTGVVGNEQAAAATPSSTKISNQPATDDEEDFSKSGDRAPLYIGAKKYPNLAYAAFASTNDTFSDQPWEQSANVSAARTYGSGGYVPKVAVIDSGVALTHQDLTDLWITNSGESGSTTAQAASRLNCTDRGLPLNKSCNNRDDNSDGITDNESGATTIENASQKNCTDQGKPIDKSCNNIDDDGNGEIDDYLGYDFMNNDRSVVPGETNPNGSGASHATLVSGVIAALNNNGRGIAGVSANARLLPLQALDDDGNGDTRSVSDAIYYAVSRGVDVINLSLGGDTPDNYLKQAIAFANQQGVVVVAAAGNGGCACNSYPAAYSAVIAVSADDNAHQLASFSNWGGFVDISAPGVNLYSTAWSAANKTSLYRYASGTSLSTPVVTGAVALLLSHYPAANPLQIKALLYEQANQSTLAQAGVRDNYHGYGYLDVLASLQRAKTPLTAEQVYSFNGIRSGQDSSSGWAQAEQAKSTVVYQCVNAHASTTVYELSRNGQAIYTVSEAERELAVATGYVSRPLFDWCVLQDYDRPNILRSMNAYGELMDAYPR